MARAPEIKIKLDVPKISREAMARLIEKTRQQIARDWEEAIITGDPPVNCRSVAMPVEEEGLPMNDWIKDLERKLDSRGDTPTLPGFAEGGVISSGFDRRLEARHMDPDPIEELGMRARRSIFREPVKTIVSITNRQTGEPLDLTGAREVAVEYWTDSSWDSEATLKGRKVCEIEDPIRGQLVLPNPGVLAGCKLRFTITYRDGRTIVTE